MRKKLAYVGIAGALVGGALTIVPSANAAARNGVCEAGEFCLYYNSNEQGSVSDFTGSISDYGDTQPSCYEFKGSGAGQGLCVKNNAASVWNRTSVPVTVYFNSGYRGASQAFAAGAKANLNATLKNENASHRFGDSKNGNENMSFALYNTSGGRLTCPFDGYTSVSGRHEGIDFARSIGSPVYALLGGTVTHVAPGANGGALSTIAIYNSAANATIIYLHAAPITGLSVGQNIGRDQQIATEAYRGISASANAHTHVEMRPGRQTHASKSLGDPVLDNPNPTAFWNARGYNVR